MPRQRRISELVAQSDYTSTSVFGGDQDNAIPGEVVCALHADAQANVIVTVPRSPERGRGLAAVAALGLGPIDQVFQSINVEAVVRVHGPSPTRVVNGFAMTSDIGLDTVYRVRYTAGDDPQAVADRLNALDDVAWAEPNRWREASIVPNDPQFSSQWGLTKIGCPQAWDVTTGDPSIVVAVIDTGVDLNHPELAALLVAGQDLVDLGPAPVPPTGWVFEGDLSGVDGVPQDEVGHGTHVAGTISTASNNGAGVAGVTWNSRLMPVRVLARIRELATDRVSGVGSSANIAAGIRWAADNGARVINMSLGGPNDTMVEREAVAYAVSKGVVVVAAMGNDGNNVPGFPAAYPDVIAVGATSQNDQLASFSNTGPHIDVVAPGVGVLSTYWDDTFATLSGTSMATPHVAGVAALVLARNPSLTSAQVGDIIRSTAKPLRDNPADPVPNERYGSGLVQAAAAVNAAGGGTGVAPAATLAITCQPSVQVICQSTPQVFCPNTNVFNCPKSVVTICPTVPQVFCPPKSVLAVCKSINTICISEPLNCPTRVEVFCQRSVFLPTCPTQNLAICPSVIAVTCQVASRAICLTEACPDSLACNINQPPIVGPIEQAADYDPFGYDPYNPSY